MTDQTTASAPRIPHAESDTTPESFRQVPTKAILNAIETTPSVKVVLPGAQTTLAARSDEFTQKVGVEAVRIAGERRAIAVDIPDVDNAVEHLYPSDVRSSATWRWALLGIIAGGLLSFLITGLFPSIPNNLRPVLLIAAVVGLMACAIWGVRLSLPKKQKP